MRILSFALMSVAALLASTATAEAEDFQAYTGRPFGVAKLKVLESQLPKFVPANGQTDWDLEAIAALFGQPVLYPVVVKNSEADAAEKSWNIHFLFQPADSVAVRLPTGNTVVARVSRGAGSFNTALSNWWSLYQSTAKNHAKADQYPAEIEQYLTMMLASKIGKKAPVLKGNSYLPLSGEGQFVAAISGTESIRLALQKEAYLKTGENVSVASLPLPEATAPPAVEIPKVEGDVDIEPIAKVVPHECFYVRFGSYSNFLWSRDTFVRWGTDFRNMASARSVDYGIAERLQNQLQLDDSGMARILGPAVVRDVAAIGNDLFLREGAAVGIILEASNNTVLSANIQLQREACAANSPDVSLQNVVLPGHSKPVSLLASADNRVRSFYVVHGDFHLVTTSQSIATRFLDVTTDKDVSLGMTDEFRYARHLNPADRDTSAFIYLSDQFFRQVVQPEFRIEMARRAKSEAEIRLVQYAQLAAVAEGVEANSIQDLIDGKYLPAKFLARCDSSKLEIQGGKVVDSLRGAAGSFLPVADVEVKLATNEELVAYAKFARDYMRIWRQMDPATISFSRIPQGDRERIVMDLHVFPIPQQTYGFFTMFLRDKSERSLALPDNCLVLADLHLTNFLPGPIFAGILDFDLPFEVTNGKVKEDKELANQPPAFAGGPRKAWSMLFGADLEVPEGEYTEIDRNGANVAFNGKKFAMVAGSKEVIQQAYPLLNYEDAERACQLRVHIADLANSKVVKFAHAKAWESSNRISTGNSVFLNRLATQFHVPATQALQTAKHVLGGTPVCPFGGLYIQQDFAGQSLENRPWISNRFYDWNEFKLPFFEHFHGADVEFSIDSNTLTTRVEFVLGVPPQSASGTTSAESDVVGE